MWLSGLRLKESIALSWDDDADFAVDLSGTYPAYRIKARAQKGRWSEIVPMTPGYGGVAAGDARGSP